MTLAGLLVMVLLLLVLRQNLLVVLGCVAAYAYLVWGDGVLEYIVFDGWDALNRDVLLSIPLYLLAGNIMAGGAIAPRLVRLMRALTGPVPGGLAIATVLSCGLFAAIVGSSIVTLLAVGSIMYPALLQAGYSRSFSLGIICAGGTLGIIIPPSVILVLYGVLTENSITALFVASVIPGLLTVVIYMFAVSIYARIAPEQAPVGPRSDWATRLATVRECWAVMLLAVAVGVGIYSGVFTVTEAASVGASFAFFIALARGRMTVARFVESIRDTATSTALIFVIIIGASVFSYFVTLSGLPQAIVQGIESLGVSPLLVIVMLQVMYLIAGAIFDEIAAMVITLPFVYPLIIGLGYDPLWWGVVNVILISMGMIIPPIGINVFVVQSMAPHIPLSRIYLGITPYVFADIARLALITLFPALCTWLPKAAGWS